MAAHMNPATLDEALHTASDDVDGRIQIIQTLVNARVYIITDKSWDGRSTPDRRMRIAMVSDGPNQQQAMLAVFSGDQQATEYVRSTGTGHPFQNVVEVPMAWVLLGVPPGTGVMLNPNTPSAFRVSPEVASELRRNTQPGPAGARPAPAKSATEQKRRSPDEEAGRSMLSSVQQFLDAGDVAMAKQAIEHLSTSGRDEGFMLCSQSLVAKYNRDYPTAIGLIKRAIEMADSEPTAGEFWSILAQICDEAKDAEQAEYAYTQACACDPGRVSYVMDFARFKASQYEIDEGLRILRDLIRTNPADPAPAIFIGNLLMDSGQHEAALAALDEAVERHPSAAGAHFNRAVCLQMLGRIDEACAAFEKALTLNPALDGYQQYMNVRKTSREDAAPDSVYRQLLERRAAEDMPASTRIDSSFALAKLLDIAGDTQRSFDYLEQANSLKRSNLRWTMADTRKDIEKTTGFFDEGFLERYQGTAASGLAPIFVLGMPRSGTTLTEQILAAHSKVNPGGELLFLSNATERFTDAWWDKKSALASTSAEVINGLKEVATRYEQLTKQLQLPGKRFTDKLPGNYLNLGFIYLLFPDASVIHCHRNPIDNCLSCYERLFTRGLNFSYDMAELGEYYRLYLEVMEKWRSIIPGDFILDMEYERLVANPEEQIRRLLDFCGLEFEETCLNFHDVKRTVTTASSLQVRKPMYKTSVARWKKYGDRLSPLLEALGPKLTGSHG